MSLEGLVSHASATFTRNSGEKTNFEFTIVEPSPHRFNYYLTLDEFNQIDCRPISPITSSTAFCGDRKSCRWSFATSGRQLWVSKLLQADWLFPPRSKSMHFRKMRHKTIAGNKNRKRRRSNWIGRAKCDADSSRRRNFSEFFVTEVSECLDYSTCIT